MAEDLYKTIYDPNGVTFEVAPERAAQLVLNKGWSNTPPPQKTPKKASKKAHVEAEAPAPEPLAADVEEEAESPNDSE